MDSMVLYSRRPQLLLRSGRRVHKGQLQPLRPKAEVQLLQVLLPFYHSDALEMILRSHAPDVNELESEQFLENYQEATDLYGLIHARFILSPRGLSLMKEKFASGKFGTCPRVLCERQPVLPIGMSEDLRVSRVKVFCPKCEDVYIPKKKSIDIDGAFFGCSFPHILLQTYPDLQPIPTNVLFVPKIFGYKIFKKKGSKYEERNSMNEITHYDEAQLKKMKSSHSKGKVES